MVRRVSRRTALVGLLVIALASGAYLLSGGGRETGGSAEGGRYDGAIRALCRAGELASENLPASRDEFFARAHDQLHEIARETQRTHRAVTARLLEVKNRVESDFGGSDAARTESDLRSLLSVSKEALVSLGASTPNCD
ncbi:MAG: hypothetical protein ACT4OM_00985 [Actinomycetota bacterium]